jgi:DNA-binding CsgD family transcriptional regulator
VQLAFSLAILAIVTAARGDEEATRAHVDGARALAEVHGLRVLDEYAGYALGLLDLGKGDAVRALEALEPVAAYVGATGRGTAGILFWPADLIQAAIRGGREDLAGAELARLEAQAARTGLRWPQAIAARCRGLLAPRDGFDAHFQSALALHAALPMDFERARTELAYGERLQRIGRRTEARAQLGSALATFERVGARTWKRATQDLYDATGERRRRSGDWEAVEELTTTELRVARAAAMGKANKVIAQELFLSVKTVEAHLTRAYRKHGVSSRTELTLKLRELGLA